MRAKINIVTTPKKLLHKNPYGLLARLFFVLSTGLLTYILVAMEVAEFADQYVNIFHFFLIILFVGLTLIFSIIRGVELLSLRLKGNSSKANLTSAKQHKNGYYGYLSLASLAVLFLAIYFSSVKIPPSGVAIETAILSAIALLVMVFATINVYKIRSVGSVVMLVIVMLVDSFLFFGYYFATYIFD